jgi:hypothetical protein
MRNWSAGALLMLPAFPAGSDFRHGAAGNRRRHRHGDAPAVALGVTDDAIHSCSGAQRRVAGDESFAVDHVRIRRLRGPTGWAVIGLGLGIRLRIHPTRRFGI